LLGFCWILVAPTGCVGTSCSLGAKRCDGKQPMHCAEPGDLPLPPEWREAGAPCAVACHETSDGNALCVDAGDPVRDCVTDGAACWQNARTLCVDGYPTATADCSGSCVVVAGCGSICADAEPEPRCADVTAFCDGDTLTACQCGHAKERTTCGTARCQKVQAASFCSIEPTRDARCAPQALYSSFCDGNSLDVCEFGFLTSRQNCAPMTCSQQTTVSASCGS